MRLGIDRLLAEEFESLKGKRIALLTHTGATDRRLQPTVNYFVTSKAIDLRMIFAPEHGIYGAVQDQLFIKDETRGKIPVLAYTVKALSHILIC